MLRQGDDYTFFSKVLNSEHAHPKIGRTYMSMYIRVQRFSKQGNILFSLHGVPVFELSKEDILTVVCTEKQRHSIRYSLSNFCNNSGSAVWHHRDSSGAYVFAYSRDGTIYSMYHYVHSKEWPLFRKGLQYDLKRGVVLNPVYRSVPVVADVDKRKLWMRNRKALVDLYTVYEKMGTHKSRLEEMRNLPYPERHRGMHDARAQLDTLVYKSVKEGGPVPGLTDALVTVAGGMYSGTPLDVLLSNLRKNSVAYRKRLGAIKLEQKEPK